jgi:hypothetical protein
MNKLFLINNMLATIGEAPVNTLSNPDEITAKAIRKLDFETTILQTTGYWFNHYPVQLPLDANSEVVLPLNTARVDAGNTNIIQRGMKLYNKYNSTFTFEKPLTVTLTILLDFDDIPLTAKMLIAATAEWLFEAQEQGDAALGQTLRYNIEKANIAFKDENLQQQNNNIYDNPSVRAKYNRQILSGGSLRSDIRGY